MDYKKFSSGGIHRVRTDKLSEIRQILEERFMKQEENHHNNANIEKSSYFIRTPDKNPKDFGTYLFGGCTTRQFESEAKPDIFCYESSRSKTFNLDLKTMKFTYSYAGTWHNEKEKKSYDGDSSVFAFGVCKKYFR